MGKFGDVHASTQENLVTWMPPQQFSGLHNLKIQLLAKVFNLGGKTTADMVRPEIKQGKQASALWARPRNS
ncbi:MAG: hypothetical protein WDM80_06165 [Limisphaerales bacterium]